MTAKTTTMPQRNLESNAMTAAIRAPRLGQIADGLAAAVAVSLPWSTSATSILIVLWIIAVVPTLDVASVRREVMSAAGGLPVLLWALGAIGMLWADVSWSERIAGLSGFHKLLLIPLLLAQFRRSPHANWVILGFLASSVVLLVVSWALVLTPGLSWRGRELGVPVKNYILQSAIFAICAFGLFGQAAELWRTRTRLALMLLVLCGGVHRQYRLCGHRAYHPRGHGGDARAVRAAAVRLERRGRRLPGRRACWPAAVWVSSPYLRARVSVGGGAGANLWRQRRQHPGRVAARILEEIARLRSPKHRSSGMGQERFPQLFRRDATAETIPALITTNPHSQILTVAVQLGVLGTVALIAMWIAHLALFRDGTLIAWFGLVLVTYNVVSSLFNSHLFDFGQGWLYVFGVGLTGGVVLRGAATETGGKP